MCDEAGVFDLQIGLPIRRTRAQLVREETLRQAVELARRQVACSSILILLDGDDDCPRELAPRLTAWAHVAAGGIASAVVVAHREYEAWFLAAIESLRGQRGIRGDASHYDDPESSRGAREALEELMIAGNSYHTTADQPALTAMFDMAAAYRFSRSFRRMVSAFGTLARAHGTELAVWPPAEWLQQPQGGA
jgi:hypothetical protein